MTSDRRAPLPRASRRRWAVLAAALCVAAAVAGGALVVAGGRQAPAITASSTSADTDAAVAWQNGTREPDATTSAAVAWQSAGVDDAWLDVSFSAPTTVSRVRIQGTDAPELAFRSALAVFDGGAAVMLTADSHGSIDTSLTERTATSVRIHFAEAGSEATAIGVAAFHVDDSGAAIPSEADVTWSASEGPARALHDGSLSAASYGESWNAGGPDAWVSQEWSSAQPISSVVVVGAGVSGGQSTGSRVVFSDGSAVGLAGIAEGVASTLAFPPRMATWARIELDPSVDGVAEMGFFREGETPPVPPVDAAASTGAGSSAGISLAEAAPSDCSRAPVESDRLELICPTPGAAVERSLSVVAGAPPGAVVSAVAESGGLPEVTLGRATADGEGRVRLDLELDGVAPGPVGLRLESDGLDPVHFTVVRPGLIPSGGDDLAPPGMTLQLREDFDDPLSVSRTGDGARYAGMKPAADGKSDFGEAVFVNPGDGFDTLRTDSGALRLRVEPAAGMPDPSGWDRDHVGGLLSSLRTDGSGFSAAYGYFEARVLVSAGTGTWGAFWMLDAVSAVRDEDSVGEVDVAELYGHDPQGSCQTLHNWSDSGAQVSPEPHCGPVPGTADAALEWHVFAARVLPGEVEFFIDGEHVTTTTGFVRHSDPYFFLLNLSLGGGWPIDLSPTGETADMYVDWVRVYT